MKNGRGGDPSVWFRIGERRRGRGRRVDDRPGDDARDDDAAAAVDVDAGAAPAPRSVGSPGIGGGGRGDAAWPSRPAEARAPARTVAPAVAGGPRDRDRPAAPGEITRGLAPRSRGLRQAARPRAAAGAVRWRWWEPTPRVRAASGDAGRFPVDDGDAVRSRWLLGGPAAAPSRPAPPPEHGLAGLGPLGYRRPDHRILEDACDRLTAADDVDARRVIVRVADGELTLAGSVPSRRQRLRAEEALDGIAGLRAVVNELRVAPPP